MVKLEIDGRETGLQFRYHDAYAGDAHLSVTAEDGGRCSCIIHRHCDLPPSRAPAVWPRNGLRRNQSRRRRKRPPSSGEFPHPSKAIYTQNCPKAVTIVTRRRRVLAALENSRGLSLGPRFLSHPYLVAFVTSPLQQRYFVQATMLRRRYSSGTLYRLQ
jgi:hypothetical protein